MPLFGLQNAKKQQRKKPKQFPQMITSLLYKPGLKHYYPVIEASVLYPLLLPSIFPWKTQHHRALDPSSLERDILAKLSLHVLYYFYCAGLGME